MKVRSSKKQGRLARTLGKMPIRSKVLAVTMPVMFIALVTAGGVVLAGHLKSSRDSLLREISAQAEMLARNSVGSLAFQDEGDAAELLSAFQAVPHVRIAGIYQSDGTLLAGFSQSGDTQAPERMPMEIGQYRWGPDRLEVSTPVVLGGEPIGCVYLNADLRTLNSLMRITLGTLMAALVLASVFTFLLMQWLLGYVTSPVINLAKAAERIAREKDFSLRMKRETDDEVGLLADTFNETLEAIARSERSYREIFNGIHDCVFLHDPKDGRILEVNSMVPKIFGYTSGEMKRLTMADISADDAPYSQDKARDNIAKALHEDGFVFNWVSRKKDGTEFPSEVALRRAEIGGEMRVIALVRDVTERRQLEEKLGQAQKMETIGTLAGGIAHDFNNILQAITGFNELALSYMGPEHPAYEKLKAVESAGGRARDLIRQLLVLSRQKAMEAKTVVFGEIVLETLNMLRSVIPATVEFKTAIDSMRAIKADPTQLQQIVMNLCVNAFQAMDKKGTISIRLRDMEGQEMAAYIPGGDEISEHYICMEVEDTGCGISREMIDKIFDPFFSTKDNRGGTGLGLTVVRRITENLRGVVKVKSEEGEGTVFSVFLPAVDDDEPEQQLQTETPLSQSNEKILVVDDEKVIASICGEYLRRLGYQVVELDSPVAALERFTANDADFDLLITDMTMPCKTGLELAADIWELGFRIPVIVATGYSEDIARVSLNNHGIRKVIQKPFNMNALAIAVRSALDEKTVLS